MLVAQPFCGCHTAKFDCFGHFEQWQSYTRWCSWEISKEQQELCHIWRGGGPPMCHGGCSVCVSAVSVEFDMNVE